MTMVIYSGNGDANKNGHDGIVNDDENNKDNAHFQSQWNDQDKLQQTSLALPGLTRTYFVSATSKSNEIATYKNHAN